jgi:hypothetical protein
LAEKVDLSLHVPQVFPPLRRRQGTPLLFGPLHHTLMELELFL